MPKEIQEDDITLAIRDVVTERQTLFEEKLSRYTEKEDRFLSKLAKVEPLKQPALVPLNLKYCRYSLSSPQLLTKLFDVR